MKKGAVMVFFVMLILNVSFIFAETNSTNERGYDCLEEKVKGECSSLSTEEKIFSLLAIGECRSDLISDSKNKECWPSSTCNIRTTAQATLALSESNTNVDKPAEWLLSQKEIPEELDWLLQIESINPTSCTIKYSGSSYTIQLDEEKKLIGHAGNCLTSYGDGYWLEILESCYETEFEISCSESFSTNLLYKDRLSSTVYVSQKTNSASGEGTTKEKVNSFCFGQGSCDYEGSLWAAIVLDSLDYDASPYVPYLVAMADSNQRFLPEVFFYLLLGDSYRTDILLKQKENKWWVESGDKFYDTALALYPFQNEQLSEKSNSANWLGEVQGSDGCWQGNIRNTAFILYSLWPKKIITDIEADDCEDSGYYCMSKSSCEDIGGEELDYDGCFGLNICCSEEKELETCEEQAGTICDSDETCIDGVEVDASDLTSGRVCCVGGECIEEQEIECELYGGYCRSTCYGNEEEKDYECLSGVCCFEKPEKPKYLGIIILSVLIFLVLIGFIFRKKLRKLWLRLRSKRKGKGSRNPGTRPGFRPGFPPASSSRRMIRRPFPRKIIPSQPKPVRRTPPRTKAKGEIDDVLKKLKEIGK